MIIKKKGFTLIELVIVIVLFSLLIGVIFQTYTTISKATFKLEQEKTLGKETLMLSQVLENIAENATIDYTKYHEKLAETEGVTDTLYLTGKGREGTSIFSSGTCFEANNFLRKFGENREKFKDRQKAGTYDCTLMLKQENEEIELLTNKNIVQSKMHFRVIPYGDNKTILEGNSDIQLGQPGFWILGTLVGKFFEPEKRTNHNILPLQFFYTLNGPTENIYK